MDEEPELSQAFVPPENLSEKNHSKKSGCNCNPIFFTAYEKLNF
jgi:hypothetical protein